MARRPLFVTLLGPRALPVPFAYAVCAFLLTRAYTYCCWGPLWEYSVPGVQNTIVSGMGPTWRGDPCPWRFWAHGPSRHLLLTRFVLFCLRELTRIVGARFGNIVSWAFAALWRLILLAAHRPHARLWQQGGRQAIGTFFGCCGRCGY